MASGPIAGAALFGGSCTCPGIDRPHELEGAIPGRELLCLSAPSASVARMRLGKPERLDAFEPLVAARQADVAQNPVAEAFQLGTRVPAVTPSDEAVLHSVPHAKGD